MLNHCVKKQLIFLKCRNQFLTSESPDLIKDCANLLLHIHLIGYEIDYGHEEVHFFFNYSAHEFIVWFFITNIEGRLVIQ